MPSQLQTPGRDRVMEGVVLTLPWLTLPRRGGLDNRQLRPRDVGGGELGVLGVLEGCAQSWLPGANFGGMDSKDKLVKRELGKDIRDRRRRWTCWGGCALGEAAWTAPPQGQEQGVTRQREVSQKLDQVDQVD